MPSNNQAKKPPQRKLSTTQIILIAGFVLIFCAIIVIAVIFLNKPKETVVEQVNVIEQTNRNAVVIDEDNLDDIDKIRDDARNNLFHVSMNTEWQFPSASQPCADAEVDNSVDNKESIYFTVTLNDTEEVIYTSSLIPVGKTLKKIVLDKQDLPKGTYAATCNYFSVSEDGTEREFPSFEISITILS